MPDEPTKSARDEATLAVPGILCVSPTASGPSVIYLGAAAGWMVPTGIKHWAHELSFMARADMTSELARTLHATLPHEQIAPKRFGMASRAVEASPFLPLASNLADGARQAGVRVHTVGIDRVSAEFYYFAEGGPAEPIRVQGNLIEMLGPSVNASSTNAYIDGLLEGLIDRLLVMLSKGVVSELDVQLADALPRLSRDGTGLEGTDLEAFDAQARALADRSARFEVAARQLADALGKAVKLGKSSASVPLYGEARQEAPSPLDVSVMGKPLTLPARSRWTVTGPARELVGPVAASRPKPTATAASTASPARAKESGAAKADAGQAKGTTEPRSVPPTASTTATAPKPAPATAVPQAAPPAKVEAPKAAPKPAASPGSAEQPRRSATKRAPFVPMFLLLAFAASLFFLWRDLH